MIETLLEQALAGITGIQMDIQTVLVACMACVIVSAGAGILSGFMSDPERGAEDASFTERGEAIFQQRREKRLAEHYADVRERVENKRIMDEWREKQR